MSGRIKNIVFDMGMVLINYDPRSVLDYYSDNEEDKAEVLEKLFNSAAWIHVDLGILSNEEILEKVLPKIRTDSAKKLCTEAMLNWQYHNLKRKPDMEKLCKRLCERGFKLYVLSNASALCRRALLDNFEGADLFSGMLFSAEAKLIKPQSLFYKVFFEKFGLAPEECLFVDDLKENIRAGEELGMRGYLFDGDSERLEKYIFEKL